MYAAISSLSLSLIATGIDSVFDLGSNLFLNYMHKRALKMDVNKWPVGGSRLETIGNIVYGETVSVPGKRPNLPFYRVTVCRPWL